MAAVLLCAIGVVWRRRRTRRWLRVPAYATEAEREADYALAMETANEVIQNDTLEYRKASSRLLKDPEVARARNAVDDAVRELAQQNGLVQDRVVPYVWKHPTTPVRQPDAGWRSGTGLRRIRRSGCGTSRRCLGYLRSTSSPPTRCSERRRRWRRRTK